MLHRFISQEPFELENGNVLPSVEIAYHTYGEKNLDGTNVVWVCHALTANAEVMQWWPGVVDDGAAIDPSKHFIVCANILGSCYGSSGPLSIDPYTGEPYYADFPQITIRDMVKAHILLRKHLQIDSISLCLGGSMGGYQALEWAIMEPHLVKRIFLIATSATESAWGIAIHEAQRLAIQADSSWKEKQPSAGAKGLKAARAIGMLTYRNYTAMVSQQQDPESEKLDNYRAASYISYQGDKLVNRFNAQSYWLLTKSMDSHNIARGRGGDVVKMLNTIKQPTLIIGITSDLLCPLEEQQRMAASIPAATFVEIDSMYGHDGFLVESKQVSHHLAEWLEKS